MHVSLDTVRADVKLCLCVNGHKNMGFVFYMALLLWNSHEIGAELFHPYHIPNKPCVSFLKFPFSFVQFDGISRSLNERICLQKHV